MWGGRRASEFFSGGGSNDFNTTEYRQYVQRFLTENNVTSVIDLGCGDFRLGRLMDWDGIAYVGIDVVAGVIEKNRKLYASENVTFLQRDMLTESLPNADLCLIRQVFQHLSNEDILAVLPKLSKYRFVLVTDGLPPVAPSIKNANKPTDYNNRFNERYGSGLYLESPPFNLRAEVVLSYPSRNRNETFRTLLKQNTS
jgi:SAM-dependent methyltransferase